MLKFIEKTKNIYKGYSKNPKKIIFRYIVFLSILIGLVLIDQITKLTLFQWNEDYTDGNFNVIFDIGILGVRSIGHRGVTLLPWKDNSIVIGFIQFFSIVIFLLLLSIPFYCKKYPTIVICAIIAAGDFGNMLDRFIFEGGMVKDIFFIPFLEKWTGKPHGTFNFADICIILGIISLVLYFFIEAIIGFKEENKKQKVQKELSEIKNDHTNDEKENENSKE
ncbi:signal peptidase II [Mycoplasmopsis meleagridis]|uniref:signal peptidase II n=1 Tax=Mycoplasmopsis meleagridis TaxID=29561 RepID=UPI00073D45C0|nr:signal peptidase II [Mycoplasmopsis meleagridis]KUH47218.1 hypothetical protein ASB56_02655 [Mycoplasmopsis meleagridis]KUH47503.1 hypothetical protein ASB56_01415 [Mycoplasmopsis meleagridis]